MVVFPNCKINLGLHITDKRSDGYHNIETIFYPVPLQDALEVIQSKEDQKEHIIFSQSGNLIEGSPENICLKAYHLLKKDFPQLPAVQVHLHKAIPTGAGLGGGSANGAFTLALLNEKFRLNLSVDQLITYSLQLGSDCPFFIVNRPCFASGRGELLEPVDISLSGYHLILINTGIHIDTGWAFSQLNIENTLHRSLPDLKNIAGQPVQSWRNILQNDFEIPVFGSYPLLQQIKEKLYAYGALYAAMSGSGSTLYGIFYKESIPQINMPAGYFVKHILL